jgi:hypothetical protein
MSDRDVPWLFLPLIGSFLAHLPVLHLDFVVGIAIVLAPLWVMPPRQVALAFAVVASLRLLISLVGYGRGVRLTVL